MLLYLLWGFHQIEEPAGEPGYDEGQIGGMNRFVNKLTETYPIQSQLGVEIYYTSDTPGTKACPNRSSNSTAGTTQIRRQCGH